VCSSDLFLPRLRSESFDLVYIDGSHYYDAVSADIAQAKRLINPSFGIICGDDLELSPSPGLIAHARSRLDMDFDTEFNYHPGVLLAVSEAFESVVIDNGFWYAICRNRNF
jgi:hypothetical protein